jgi:hypothetical protein
VIARFPSRPGLPNHPENSSATRHGSVIRSTARRLSRSVAPAVAMLLALATVASAARLDHGRPLNRHLAPGVQQIIDHRLALVGGTNAERGFLALSNDAVVPSFAVPVAHAANANTVVGPFVTRFVTTPVPGHAGERELVREDIHPFLATEDEIGGCFGCPHHRGGGFRPGVRHGRTESFRTRGPIILTAQTRVATVVFQPGEIGRFKLYRVDVSTANLVLVAEGCVPADVTPVFEDLKQLRTVPKVPCQSTEGARDKLNLSAPVEVSASSGVPGIISGFATGGRWLSIFQTSGVCAPDAQAEAARTPDHVFRQVIGSFRVSFTTAPDRTSGFFCVYLQTGGTYKVRTGGREVPVPDGRLTVTDSAPFSGGDAVTISAPPTATANQPVATTIAGRASLAEQLYVFAAYVPCAASAQADYPQAVGYFTRAVRGAFSIGLNTVPLAQTATLCAYLQVGNPTSANLPTGPTLVRTSRVVGVVAAPAQSSGSGRGGALPK